MFCEPLSCALFILTTDFADHDDAFGLWVIHEAFKDIDEVSSFEGVATDSDDCALSESTF